LHLHVAIDNREKVKMARKKLLGEESYTTYTHTHIACKMTFDPLSPSLASTSKDHTTFRTLTRERAFRHPPTDGPDIAALEELVKPHIESFNALIDDAGTCETGCEGQ
jgi:hypothetical protein